MYKQLPVIHQSSKASIKSQDVKKLTVHILLTPPTSNPPPDLHSSSLHSSFLSDDTGLLSRLCQVCHGNLYDPICPLVVFGVLSITHTSTHLLISTRANTPHGCKSKHVDMRKTRSCVYTSRLPCGLKLYTCTLLQGVGMHRPKISHLLSLSIYIGARPKLISILEVKQLLKLHS